MIVEIRTAAELLADGGAADRIARRTQRDDPLLRAIWREFVEHGGPVALAGATARVPGLSADAARARAIALDAADLIDLAGDTVRLAYPFTAFPSMFEVCPRGGRAVYACCAIDALGVAPMLGTPAAVRTRCHSSGAPLRFDVDPVAGPCDPPRESLVWVERGRKGGDRLSGFL